MNESCNFRTILSSRDVDVQYLISISFRSEWWGDRGMSRLISLSRLTDRVGRMFEAWLGKVHRTINLRSFVNGHQHQSLASSFLSFISSSRLTTVLLNTHSEHIHYLQKINNVQSNTIRWTNGKISTFNSLSRTNRPTKRMKSLTLNQIFTFIFRLSKSGRWSHPFPCWNYASCLSTFR